MNTKKFNRMRRAVENGAIPYVEWESRRIAHLIKDMTAFEQRCYEKIGKAIEIFSGNGRDKRALIQYIIKQERNHFLKKHKLRNDVAIEYINEEGTVWEPEDVSTNVVGEVLLKEKVALLAQGDPRKRVILEAWIRGCTNDTDISTLLAQRFGGNARSHCRFIQRFRSRCQSQLAA
ncbi:hypothetical protein OZL92_20745 [Bacillus sonorensis]|uniref:Uncharacterized protein n=2 Tax=Bacillus TaxID=1386 RepID=A0AAJ4D1R8_9BACI|nr:MULTISPECIES: hypothetical protein [Bacillus]EME76183.1 hypothetical protein BSONL12_04394 [Bacillus sonorensis L12]KRT88681.1 hypothetical protein ACH97_222080 [Bacillus paralicheniformis]MCZ0074649.1 hypothetical protein [Bacillus sonorensis]MCZ0093757.1 hypothetical protein [Bacillus sonorensis]PAD61827.1 hypothetical protein CHH92_01870 [Bacillus sonorensis]